MIHSRSIRFIASAFALTALGVTVAGCPSNAGDSAVSEEVKKSTAASGASGSSPYGKVGTESAMPPPGKPPEVGTDMSKRGGQGTVRPAQ